MDKSAAPTRGGAVGDWRPTDDVVRTTKQISGYTGEPEWKIRADVNQKRPGLWREGRIICGSKQQLKDEYCRKAGLINNNL